MTALDPTQTAHTNKYKSSSYTGIIKMTHYIKLTHINQFIFMIIVINLRKNRDIFHLRKIVSDRK